MNKSGILPVEYNVVVLPDAIEEKTKGGLHMPDSIKERDKFAQMKATVVAISALAFTRTPDGDAWAGPCPVVGGRVLLAQYSGVNVTGDDGVDYRVVKDGDIVAILEAAHV